MTSSTGTSATHDPSQFQNPWLPVLHRVVDVVAELADTVSIDLEPIDGPPNDGPPNDGPRPGQFNMLWAFGVGEVPISFSILPTDDTPMRHTVRAVGAVTRALCALQVGDVVGVRGPFGTSWQLDEGDRDQPDRDDVVLVAGGLGLAPLRPVIDRLARDSHTDHSVTAVFGARSPDLLLYAGELDRWSEGGIDVRLIVDEAGPEWNGRIGVVTELLAEAVTRPDSTQALVCGPEIMMRFAARTLVDLGVPDDRIQVSLERNMACGMGRCGHCQLRELFVCTDGPVVSWSRVGSLLGVREL